MTIKCDGSNVGVGLGGTERYALGFRSSIYLWRFWPPWDAIALGGLLVEVCFFPPRGGGV